MAVLPRLRSGWRRLRFDVALAIGVLLRRRQARFQALVQHSSDVVAIFDAEGRISYVSPAVERLVGRRPEELVGMDAFAFVHPDDLSRAQASFAAIAATPGASGAIDVRSQHADGSWRWFETTVTNLLAEPAVGGIVVNTHDVTDAKRTEADLAEERDLLHVLMNSLPDFVFFKDPASRFVRINQAGAWMIGVHDPREAIGKSDADYLPAEIAAAFVADDQQVMTTRTSVVDRIEPTVTADGSVRWLSTTKAPTIGAEGEITGVVGIARDITGRKAAEVALRDNEERLRLALAAAHMGTWDWDLVTGELAWSEETEILAGQTPGRRIYAYADFLAALHPDDRPAVELAVAGALESGSEYAAEYRMVMPDGGYRWSQALGRVERDGQGLAVRMLGVAMDITARKTLEAQVTFQAFHDPLTGLPNRALFLDRLEQALRTASRRGEAVAVFFLDLDRFKHVNDGFGHEVGDRVLAAVGERLAGCLMKFDTLARFGGDEFVMLVEGASPGFARALADRLLAALQEPVDLEQEQVYVAASIGFALSTPDRASADVLLRTADTALYQAKRSGCGIAVAYDPAMEQADLGTWIAREADLHRALARSELELHYQPIVDLADGTIVAVEALVRWVHPLRGLVPAVDFVALAEETGLIVPIDSWVLAEACRQMRMWQTELGPLAPEAINVNLAARDLADPDLVDRVRGAIREAGLAADRVRMEISEQVLVDELRATSDTLRGLREVGVRLAIDDFGAGASALASLYELDADGLKLDRAFAHRLGGDNGDRTVVAGVTALAHAVGMSVILEGIETNAQLAAARAAGCDRGQGHLFARPLAAGDVTHLLRHGLTRAGSPNGRQASPAYQRSPVGA